ncbi:MAG: ATP-dependent helicase [Planctomycetota bacterium]
MRPSSERLNPRQRRAVEHSHGPLLVLAGPGSGKTRVMTHRIAHLVACGEAPEGILAITFTNKAADEMLRRTEKLLGAGGAPELAAVAGRAVFAGDRLGGDTPLICTFHSFCARLLRREIYRLDGYRADFTIYDTADQLAVVEEALAKLELDKSSFPPRACRAWISRWKNRMSSPEEVHAQARTYNERTQARIYARYQHNLVEWNALDFDDLLLLALRLLREDDGARERCRARHRSILIDEFQDTNRPQYLIARILAQEHRNLCVTGDPDQSIYSWRGASPENFARFREDFPEHESVHLDENYRSTPQILAAANRLSGRELGSRALFTRKPAGESVVVRRLGNEREEALEIVHRALEWEREGTPLGEVAVLYRVNALSRSIEEELVRARVAYTVVGGVAFYQRKEVKDVLCYLRAAASPRDDLALRRILNTPSRGFGRVSQERFEDAAADRGLPLGEALEDDGALERVPTRARKALQEVRRILHALRSRRDLPLHQQVQAAVEESGYLEFLERSEPETWRERSRNLDELAAAAAETEDLLRAARPAGGEDLDPLRIFLERIALVTDIDLYEERENRLTLMTLHGAKGLEYDRVIIAGVEETLLPHARAGEESSEEEERRLLYVGITRARMSALLLHCAWRRRFRDREPRLPSPFLEEISGQEVVFEDAGFSATSGPTGFSASGGAFPGAAPAYDPHDEDDEMRPGVWLSHDLLGRGVITMTSGFGASKRITVAFEEHGEKQLVAAYAPLRVISPPDGV